MLERVTVTGEETNKYFIHNNGIAKEWEKLADEYNGKIKGQVNGQILEFDLDFEIDKFKIHISQLRQLSNKQTGTLFDDGLLMSKNTIIELLPIDAKSDDWKIILNSNFASLWYRLIGFSEPLAIDPKYLVVSKKRLASSDLLTQREFNYLKKMAELRSVVKKDSVLKIEYFTALGTDSTMKIINAIIKGA